MTTFGIKAYICSSTPSYFVGEDENLWEWLLADNGIPIGLPNMKLVPAPDGYKFLRDKENGVGTEEAEGMLVFTKDFHVEKASRILEFLKSVEPEEFEALNLDESRIMKIFI